METDFTRRLLATFRVEAKEHIGALSAGLVELERVSSPEQQMEIVERVFREAHSLKGAARAVNLAKIEATCQSLESSFDGLKGKSIGLSPELFDRLHRMVDTLEVLLAEEITQPARANESGRPQMPALSVPTNIVVPSMSGPAPQNVEAAAFYPATQGLPETLRVQASRLDVLLRQAEELIPAKATAGQRVIELREITQVLASWEADSRKIRAQAHALPSLANGEPRSNGGSNGSNGGVSARSSLTKVSTFLDRNENALKAVRQKLTVLGKRLEYDRRALERRVDDLVEDLKQVSMLPFSVVLESFPKLVRDLSRDCGKEAELLVVGGEIETDRRIMDEMKDPLVHLVRNCIDHGIETPDQRKASGKPPRASIRIAISAMSADKVEIVIADDGAGIDLQKVRAASVKFGVASEEDVAKMDAREGADLIFKSGVSTSSMITEISGRGLGLAIVREKAERVGGAVSVETLPGKGTTFRLMLPLTLARFRGVLVRVGESLFVLPTRHVQRVLRVSKDEIKTVENRETIQINGRTASAVHLRDVLELTQAHSDSDAKRKLPVLVVSWAGEQIGFFVDEILDEQEVLVKSLGKQLPRVRNVAGATILGTGKVLPVLNVEDLMYSAVKMAPAGVVRQARPSPKSILVAEDSITSRTLLKNILELAGYTVKTAIDGAEAFTVLTGEAFDLVVSDVEMPRMSGFDLTAKIRADKRFPHLPVVLVTALDTREDRERGADVGANAYIVKSGFDQGNLLDVVRRLI